jgi:hypothetical protein
VSSKQQGKRTTLEPVEGFRVIALERFSRDRLGREKDIETKYYRSGDKMIPYHKGEVWGPYPSLVSARTIKNNKAGSYEKYLYPDRFDIFLEKCPPPAWERVDDNGKPV